MEPPTLGANSTKQLIVEILSKEWPLSARSVYSKLTKKHQLSVTYQAVHKALKEMSSQSIIIKDENAYKLHTDWIKQLNEFGEKVRKEYENPKPRAALEYCFSNLFEAYMFFLSELEKNLEINIDPENTAIFHGLHVWLCLPARSEEEARLKVVTDKTKIYTIGKCNYKIDGIMRKYWESFGIKMKLDVPCLSNFEVIVIGDNVYYLHFPKELLDKMELIYSKINDITDIDIAMFNKEIIYKPCKIYIVINENKDVAKLIKDWTMQQFEEDL